MLALRSPALWARAAKPEDDHIATAASLWSMVKNTACIHEVETDLRTLNSRPIALRHRRGLGATCAGGSFGRHVDNKD
jgi:hypothetical protein